MSSTSKDGLLAVCGTLLGLSTLTVGLRYYTRGNQKLRFRWDDWFALAGLVCYLGAAICVFLLVHIKAAGYTSTQLPLEQIKDTAEESAKLQIAWDVLTDCTLASTKLSAVFFYRRIFCGPGSRGWFDVASLATIAVIVMWLITFVLISGLQCGTHFSALWNFDGPYQQYCTISFPFLLGVNISDLILDLWILALPIPRVLQLQTKPAKKASIIGIFLLAFVGLGAAIAKVVVYVQAEVGGKAYFVHFNMERALTQTFYLVMLESGISLVAVNLPSLWMLLTSIVPQKIIRSFHSLTSFRSARSGGSRSSADAASSEGPGKRGDYNQTIPSETDLHKDLEGQEPGTYAMQDVGKVEQGLPKTSIHVKSSVA